MAKTAFEKLADMQRELEKKIKDEGADALKEYFGQKFDEISDLEAVRITGYVPGFNDGDPCTFSLNETEFKVSGVEGTSDEDYDDESPVGWATLDDFNGEYVGWFDAKPVLKPGQVLLEERFFAYNDSTRYRVGANVDQRFFPLGKINDDVQANEAILNSAFGDNFRVTITRDTITVDEYDCGF